MVGTSALASKLAGGYGKSRYANEIHKIGALIYWFTQLEMGMF